VFVVVVTSVEL